MEPAGPNLKKLCMTAHKISSEQEASLLTEELQLGSESLPFEKGEEERGGRGGDGAACRKKG